MRWGLMLMVVAGLVAAGCGGEDPFNQPSRQVNPEGLGVVTDPLSASPSPPPPAAGPSDEQPGEAGTSPGAVPPPPNTGVPPAPPQTTDTAVPPAPPEAVQREEAHVGVGKKGDYGPGMVTTPISAYWRTRERVSFEIQIPSAMNLYKGIHGKAPQTHEEFMEKIIKENHIELPELPPGHRYVYDPETEQLMVERPR